LSSRISASVTKATVIRASAGSAYGFTA
jgi:hypothetical protein